MTIIALILFLQTPHDDNNVTRRYTSLHLYAHLHAYKFSFISDKLQSLMTIITVIILLQTPHDAKRRHTPSHIVCHTSISAQYVTFFPVCLSCSDNEAAGGLKPGKSKRLCFTIIV